jgi:flagellar biosynthetic protein FlhB
MSEQSNEERTEQPTEKRRREFREEGQVAQSKEVNTAFLLSFFLLLWFFYAPDFVSGLMDLLHGFWSRPAQMDLRPGSVSGWLVMVLLHLAGIFWPFLLLGVIIALLASYIQIGWLFTFKPMQPKLSKLDPIKGAAKFVSKKSGMELVKSLLKILVVAVVAYWVLSGMVASSMELLDRPVSEMLAFIGRGAAEILFKCCLALVFIAILDYAFVRWEMEEKMKMTKKEVKDEHKETEGDPQLKQRMRSIQRDMARKRMMAEVPKADVVITNPTRLAVALSYEQRSMEAPEIMAKGRGKVAERIREIAMENDVPIVENKPVAQGLYSLEVGDAIPESMFKAVAEILAYVYSLQGARA